MTENTASSVAIGDTHCLIFCNYSIFFSFLRFWWLFTLLCSDFPWFGYGITNSIFPGPSEKLAICMLGAHV